MTLFVEDAANLRLQLSDLLSQRIVGACPPGVFRRPLLERCLQARRLSGGSRKFGLERCHLSEGVLETRVRGGLDACESQLQPANLRGVAGSEKHRLCAVRMVAQRGRVKQNSSRVVV